MDSRKAHKKVDTSRSRVDYIFEIITENRFWVNGKEDVCNRTTTWVLELKADTISFLFSCFVPRESFYFKTTQGIRGQPHMPSSNEKSKRKGVAIH
jgi:hypothetical protein